MGHALFAIYSFVFPFLFPPSGSNGLLACLLTMKLLFLLCTLMLLPFGVAAFQFYLEMRPCWSSMALPSAYLMDRRLTPHPQLLAFERIAKFYCRAAPPNAFAPAALLPVDVAERVGNFIPPIDTSPIPRKEFEDEIAADPYSLPLEKPHVPDPPSTTVPVETRPDPSLPVPPTGVPSWHVGEPIDG